MPGQNALILNFLLTDDESHETQNILKQLQLYDFDVEMRKVENGEKLKEVLEGGEKYDLVYLSAHGDEDGFSNEAEDYKSSWKNFGELIYNSSCLAKDNILLLSCCRGGLNKVAYEMFYICPEIEYICGPRISLDSCEMLIGFNVFLFNTFYRNIDPIISAEKVLLAADIKFKCFDRLETVSETGYLVHTEVIDIIPVDTDDDGNKDSIIVVERDKNVKVYNEEDASDQLKVL
ncbi:MAG: hypothetical protein JKX82_00465 [Oleispira sp.]|nr:hypothetical protein [Oleispira sp.]